MSIPAEEYVNASMLCQEIEQYLLKMQAFIRKTPGKFGGNVDPRLRLATGVLRSDKISELAKARDHMRLAVDAAEQLGDVHYTPTWEHPAQAKLTSKPMRPRIYDEWPESQNRERPR